ncbi:hypothetical protein HY990_00150 [Candidatus Micrarchaeota archaeon]|nr:hypothetical protein [Candidatus Micrarchaeota archaeon]
MVDVIFALFDRLSYAWAVIIIAIFVDMISGFLFNPGSGIVKSGLAPRTILTKKFGFTVFLALTFLFGIMDPQGIVQWLYHIIHADGNLFGSMGWIFLFCVFGTWVYFNLRAGLNPLSLGSV